MGQKNSLHFLPIPRREVGHDDRAGANLEFVVRCVDVDQVDRVFDTDGQPTFGIVVGSSGVEQIVGQGGVDDLAHSGQLSHIAKVAQVGAMFLEGVA